MSVAEDSPPDTRADGLTDAVEAAVAFLRREQHADGWWKGELETNVSIEAEDLLLRQFLGILRADETQETARWIRSKQRADGSWANFFGGPGELSTCVEAWVALRLAGDRPEDEHMAAAAAFIRASGGVEGSRVFTRIWLALFGLWPWDALPTLPPELILLPRRVPLNVYDFACWARQTIVPLTVVCTLRPVRPLPFGIDELRTGQPAARPAKVSSWAGAFQRLDRVLAAYARHPLRPLRRLAMRRAAEWVIARQESDGSWGGIQPPWVYSVLALHLLGYPLDHPSVRAGITGLEGFVVREQTPDGIVRRLEACQSPVWDTALALTALLDAGVPAEDPMVARAADWLVAEEITVTGDWSVRRPELAPSGWAFEFANDGYPDTDDAAEVLLALRRTNRSDDASVERGTAWVAGMQSKDGGWGAFDADNTSRLPNLLPFCDFGEVVDPPSADVTAHVIEMLAQAGLSDSLATLRGVSWLLDAQEPDGSWFGRWGANYVYGTGAALPALIACGLGRHHPAVRRGLGWLEDHQAADGGWGEDLRSYREPSWRGRGTPTASQTAWALLGLMAGGGDEAAIERGIRWLVDRQQPDGTWDEPEYTGTGFPGDFYLNYHLYRHVFPLTALGRYRSRLR
ncbi:MAG: squalene-hopene/tetraprenyl-beta-curcumene cyclase [Frankiales bacterium]|nr:squalene-hopene/tetraprenyl-beta-curcumene cyclase [Frankiales bacterium]